MIGSQIVRRFATSALLRHGAETGGRPGMVCYTFLFFTFTIA